ncbi:Hypothetical predicted protein, partial [Olea europaea subsp. europaea]
HRQTQQQPEPPPTPSQTTLRTHGTQHCTNTVLHTAPQMHTSITPIAHYSITTQYHCTHISRPRTIIAYNVQRTAAPTSHHNHNTALHRPWNKSKSWKKSTTPSSPHHHHS